MRLYLKIVGALAVALSISPSFAQTPKDYTYLALGDSIAFGFDPLKFAGPALPKPTEFVGYPEIVALNIPGLRILNAACPGETSGSFVFFKSPDNGCNSLGPQGQQPFKTSIGLKANYRQSQLTFALSQIRSNKNIRLITISLGGNDLSLLQKTCANSTNFPTCVVSALHGVIANFGVNLSMILDDIRNRADYRSKIILVTNYSPSADPLVTLAVGALNVEMSRVGGLFGATIADGFTAFQLVSQPFGGDPCAAGLLVRLSDTVCDIHPSVDGQKLLAATVLLAPGQ